MKILIATDGSAHAEAAARLVLETFRPEAISVVVLTVTWPPHSAPIWDEATMIRAIVDDMHYAVAVVAHDAMQRVASELRVRGFSVATEIAIGDPADAIVRFAEETDVDVIVLGRHTHPASEHSVLRRVFDKWTGPIVVGGHAVENAVDFDSRPYGESVWPKKQARS